MGDAIFIGRTNHRIITRFQCHFPLVDNNGTLPLGQVLLASDIHSSLCDSQRSDFVGFGYSVHQFTVIIGGEVDFKHQISMRVGGVGLVRAIWGSVNLQSVKIRNDGTTVIGLRHTEGNDFIRSVINLIHCHILRSGGTFILVRYRKVIGTANHIVHRECAGEVFGGTALRFCRCGPRDSIRRGTALDIEAQSTVVLVVATRIAGNLGNGQLRRCSNFHALNDRRAVLGVVGILNRQRVSSGSKIRKVRNHTARTVFDYLFSFLQNISILIIGIVIGVVIGIGFLYT